MLRRPHGSVTWADRMKLDAVDERVLLDRSGVRGPPAQRLAVGLAGSADVFPTDRRKRDQRDGVDLDLTKTDPVATALPDPWLLPQSDRECDVSGQNVAAQLAAELHGRDANSRRALRPRLPDLLVIELARTRTLGEAARDSTRGTSLRCSSRSIIVPRSSCTPVLPCASRTNRSRRVEAPPGSHSATGEPGIVLRQRCCS